MVSRPGVDQRAESNVASHGEPRPATRLDLSIVIVSWNTRELLARCLRSIPWTTGAGTGSEVVLGSPKLASEVLVVDNGSDDDSAKMVRDEFPEVQLIANDDNPGFARANNQAIRRSSGRYVLLLNPDTEVQPGALDRLVRFMDGHQRAGAAGPLLLNPDGTLQLSCYRSPSLSRELWRMFHLDALCRYNSYPVARWNWDQPREVDVVQGACLIVRREALEQVGGLDEDYFIYSEEVDLCERLRHRGWTVHWVPRARVVHFGGQSTRQVANAMFLQLYRAKIQYFRKHHGRQSARVYKLILGLAAAVRLLLYPIAFLKRGADQQEKLAVATNYRQLIRQLVRL